MNGDYGTKMKARLPKLLEDNGLGALRRQLVDDPEAEHVGIVVFTTEQITEKVSDGMRFRIPTIELLRFEPETDPDEAVRLLARARELSDERLPTLKPLLDPQEASGLRNGAGLRLASGSGNESH